MTPAAGSPAGGGFGARLAAATSARGPLCAGIDPHPGLLADWGLPADAGGLERFAMAAVSALATESAVIKPQSGLFEPYGAAGIAVLERVVAAAREAGALVLLDVKRGDIGSTMAGYAAAYLGDGSPLECDAITASPYLGFGSLRPALELAQARGKGVFALARTSNPEAAEAQRATLPDGRTVAQSIVDAAAERNAGASPQGGVGVVVGATIEPGELRLGSLNGPILAPGVGAQGAGAAELRAVFAGRLPAVLPATSRELLRHGPGEAGLRAAARRTADELAEALAG